MAEHKPAAKTLLSRFLVCLFYGLTSGSLSLLMKKLLSRYGFSGFFLLLSSQMGLQLALCILSRDRMGNPFSVPDYDRATHMTSLRLGVTGVGNVAVGMLGLQLVNIPMFLCIRRLVAPFILLYEAVVLGRFASLSINTSVAGILLGTLVAGYETLSSDLLGYVVVVINNVLSAATSVMQKQFSTEKKLDALGVLYYNSMTAFPLSLFLAIAMGEVSALSTFPYRADPGFAIAFTVCTCMGPLITYSTILCTTYNSALTTSITGNVKDIGLTIVGALAFGDFSPTVSSVGGILLSFAGAAGYSWISYTSSASASSSSSAGAGAGAGAGGSASSAEGAAADADAAAAAGKAEAGQGGGGGGGGSGGGGGGAALGEAGGAGQQQGSTGSGSAGSGSAGSGSGGSVAAAPTASESASLLTALEEGGRVGGSSLGSGRPILSRKSMTSSGAGGAAGSGGAAGGAAAEGGSGGPASPERSGMVSVHAGIALITAATAKRAKGT